MKEPGPSSRPSSSIYPQITQINLRNLCSKNCRRTLHARSRNRVQSYRLCLRMKHCSICHRVAVGMYRVDSYTYYRPPWDSSSKLLVCGGAFERVATNRLLSQSRLPRARCSRGGRCSLATLRRRCVQPFESVKTESTRLR